MFLPFLPLILASASLTLLSVELERPEPWLNLPLAVTLPLIILIGFLLAQMTQRLWEFSHLKQFPVAEEDSYPSVKLTPARILTLIFWLALVYGEHVICAKQPNKQNRAPQLNTGHMLMMFL